MTAIELAHVALAQNPGQRYAVNANGTGVAGWNKTLNRWQLVAGKLITGTWASLPHELLINGKPTHTQSDWTEVTV